MNKPEGKRRVLIAGCGRPFENRIFWKQTGVDAVMSYPLVGGGEGMRMEQIGIIREIRDGLAVVEVHRQSACAGCSKSGCCMGMGHGCAVMLLEAENRAGAHVGDLVSVASPTRCVLGYARCCLCSTLSALSDSLLYHSVPMADRMALGRLHCSGCCCLPGCFLRLFLERKAKRLRYVIWQIKTEGNLKS